MNESMNYYEWLLDFVCDEKDKQIYSKLFWHLFNTEFTYIFELDSNRMMDGLGLRNRYENETGDQVLYKEKYCSILEMIIALSIRVEDEIMANDEYGNRTGRWFWAMISNLELISMKNNKYNEDYVDFIISRFLNREYEFNGSGGLFKIDNFEDNMQNIEIWYQAIYYFNYIIEREENV